MRSHRIASGEGVSVVAHDHEGSGPPVIFCHATGLHGRIWDPVCEPLADRFRCVAIDLRGHGDSRIPARLDLAWSGMAADILSVIDTMELGSEVLAVGHSMGGAAIVMAELARPGTVARAWAFEPIVIPAGTPEFGVRNPLAETARRRREIFPSRDAAYDQYMSKSPFGGCDPRSVRAYVDHGFADQPDGSVILKCRPEIEAQVFEHSLSGSFERLADLQTPYTVAGSGDGHPPADAAPLIAAAMPKGEFEAWPHLTHFGPMEAPEEIAAAIERTFAADPVS